MLEIIFFTVVYVYFAIFDLYLLYKEKKSFWINASIFGFSYILCILVSFGVIVPSPAVPIQRLIYYIFGKH